MGTILIRGIRQLLTLRGTRGPRRGADQRELGVISEGSLLIRDGVITQVGPTRRVENLAEARGALEINAYGRVVMPGFVDSHTHLLSARNEEHTLRTTTAKVIQAKATAHLESMARHGTTTVGVQTGFTPDERAERKAVRVLSALQGKPLDLVPAFQFQVSGEDAQGIIRGFLAKFRDHITFADLVWTAAPADEPLLAHFLEAARSFGFSSRIHVMAESPSTAITMALTHSVCGITHLEHAIPAEVARLSGSGMVATLLPCESFSHGEPAAPARALVDGGVPVALATNFDPGHMQTLSMQSVMTIACKRMGLSPEEAITATTINGAHAAGCAHRAGSLEAGKPADLVILNVSHYADIANHFGVNLVHQTMKRGEFIYQEGKVAQEVRLSRGERRSA